MSPETGGRRASQMQRPLIAFLVLVVVGAALLTGRPVAQTPRASAAAPAGPNLTGKVVHLDAGHNGGNARAAATINALVDAGGGVRKACDTTGTETNDGKLAESVFTLDVALRTRTRLQAMGATVVMTRTTNTGVGPCITKRAAIGNAAKADAAISIHADGGPPSGRGFHVIEPGGVKGQSKRLITTSDLLARRVRTALKQRGYRTANYIAAKGLDRRTDLGGLNLSRVPKVFVELGNMRSAADAALLKSPAQRGRMAEGLAAALAVQLSR